MRNYIPSVLLLQPLEENINSVLSGLRKEFGGTSLNQPIHITLRGPHKDRPAPKDINKWKENISRQTILIRDIGIFQNPGETVVYIKAYNEGFKKIFWKPDFKDQCNPHISLYRGSDDKRAKVITEFLQREDLRFTCEEFILDLCSLKQMDALTHHQSNQPHTKQPEVVIRAAEMIKRYNQEHNDKVEFA